MAFWSQANFKEPLRANKWYIEFTSILRDARFALKECKKPSYKISETKHRCFNYVVNLPGTLTWDPINIKFASVKGDTVSKDASVLIYNVLRNGGSQVPKTFLESTLSKTRMNNALEAGLLNIIQVDHVGIPVEVWSLYNAYISVTNFGSLSYDNENIVDIDCTITYDWAELNNQERGRRLGLFSEPQPIYLPTSEKQPEIQPPEPPPAQPAAEASSAQPAQPAAEASPAQSAQPAPEAQAAQPAQPAPEAQAAQPPPEPIKKQTVSTLLKDDKIFVVEKVQNSNGSYQEVTRSATAAEAQQYAQTLEKAAEQEYDKLKTSQNLGLARNVLILRRQTAAAARNAANELSGNSERVEASRAINSSKIYR